MAAVHGLRFGAHLMRAVPEGPVGFGELHSVAHELVSDSPELAAHYLACLVALDIEREAGGVPVTETEPSPN